MAESNTFNSDKRLSWIDYSRGIGIILVVYGHVVRGLKDPGILSLDHTFWGYSDTFVYSFHMRLFFVLSGYFFLRSFKKEPSDFILKKVQTLIYPFVIWSVLQTIVEVLLSKYTNGKVAPIQILECIIIPRAQFWFLYTLFFINVLSFIFYKISIKYGLYISTIIWLACFIFQPQLGPFNTTFNYLLFFNIGIVFSQLDKSFLLFLKNYIFCALTIIAFCVVEYIFLFSNTKPISLYRAVILPFLGSLAVMQVAAMAVRKNILNFFVYLGKESLPIYLAHVLVASGIRIVLFKILKIHNPIIHVLLGTIAGIIVPLILYSFVMKRRYLSMLFSYPKKHKLLKNNVPS